MSSIVYSGGTIINTTFTCVAGTRAEIVTGLGAALVAAGWQSLGSGLYRSAETAAPKSNSIRVKLTDPGSGNCARVQIQNDTGDRVSQQAFLLPGAGKVYRVIACQYNFFCFTPGSSAGREYVAAGTLHIPDHLDGITAGSLGWLQGNAINDGDGTARASFRNRLSSYDPGASSAIHSVIRNGSLLDLQNGAFGASLGLVAIGTSSLQQDSTKPGYRWADDSVAAWEAIMYFGVSGQNDEAKRQGLLHNCFVSADSYAADTVPTAAYDGHNWFAITGGNGGNGGAGGWARGTLFVATN